MDIEFSYGKTALSISVPDENVLMAAEPKRVPPIEDERAEVVRALENPIGTKRISEIAGPGKKVALIVDDDDRPKVSTHIIAPIVLEELEQHGVRREDITIVVAYGSRIRRRPIQVVNSKIGKYLLDNYKVVHHECDDLKKQKFYGYSSMGTPIWINRAVAEADLKIGIGMIKASFMGGFSGGSKIVVPGIAGRWTIHHNHARCFSSDNLVGSTEGPVTKDRNDIARRIGLTMKVDYIPDNTTIDEETGILTTGLVRVFAGDVVEEWKEAVKAFNEIYGVKVPRKADILITSPGIDNSNTLDGFAVWNTIPCTAQLVKPGGSIIYANPCYNKYTRADFEIISQYRDKTSVEEFAWQVDTKIHAMGGVGFFSSLGLWGDLLFYRIRVNHNFFVVPEGLTEDECRYLGFNYAESIEEALQEALKKQGDKAKVTIISNLARHTMPVPFNPPSS